MGANAKMNRRKFIKSLIGSIAVVATTHKLAQSSLSVVDPDGICFKAKGVVTITHPEVRDHIVDALSHIPNHPSYSAMHNYNLNRLVNKLK